MKILINHEYDPINDLYLNKDGLLQLINSKAEMIKDIKKYFGARKEDRKDVDKTLVSMNRVYLSPEKVLKNAHAVKRVIEIEKWRQILKLFNSTEVSESESSSKLCHENDGPGYISNMKRSKSYEKKSNRPKLQTPKRKPPKKLEVYFEMEINIGLENFNNSNSSFSSSTEESKLNRSISSFTSEEISKQNLNNSYDLHNLTTQYGKCCSKTKPEETKKLETSSQKGKITEESKISETSKAQNGNNQRIIQQSNNQTNKPINNPQGNQAKGGVTTTGGTSNPQKVEVKKGEPKKGDIKELKKDEKSNVIKSKNKMHISSGGGFGDDNYTVDDNFGGQIYNQEDGDKCDDKDQKHHHHGGSDHHHGGGHDHHHGGGHDHHHAGSGQHHHQFDHNQGGFGHQHGGTEHHHGAGDNYYSQNYY
jgi:hypothetical protein